MYTSTYEGIATAHPKQNMIHEQEYLVHCLNAKLACLITSEDVDETPESSNIIVLSDSAFNGSSSSDTETSVTNSSVELTEDFQYLMHESFPFSCDALNPSIVEVEFSGSKSRTDQLNRPKKFDVADNLRITPITSCEDAMSDLDSDFNTTTGSLSYTNEFLPFLDWTDALTV